MKHWTLTYDEPDRYGRRQVRTVNRIIDIADFRDAAGFPYLLMAANPHLSIRDIQAVLSNTSERLERPTGWISRRRWLFHGKGKSGAKPNVDGKDEKARQIMSANPRMSARQISYRLRKELVPRPLEWIRKNRVENGLCS